MYTTTRPKQEFFSASDPTVLRGRFFSRLVRRFMTDAKYDAAHNRNRRITENWHLSKAVPLALIAAILAQAFIITWYGSQMASTFSFGIERNTVEIRRINEEMAFNRQAINRQEVQLARIEENTRTMSGRVASLVRILEQQYNDSVRSEGE